MIQKITKNLFRVLFLALISISLMMTSCEDDDDVDPIVGTWKLEKVTMNGDEIDLDVIGISATVTFKDDGTYSGTANFEGNPESISGTWERKDSETVYIYEDTETIILKKEGEYYTNTEQEYSGETLITMKMFFKKQ